MAAPRPLPLHFVPLDSDAALNPRRFDRSLHDALNEWRDHTARARQHQNTTSANASATTTMATHQPTVLWGPADPADADLLFFHNFPWRADLPCAGTWVVKVRALL